MTDQQLYEVIDTFGEVELRRYEPCVIAEVAVDASFESAGNQGFRPLFSFISGKNGTGAKVAMTAPVLQQIKGARTDGDSYSVSFVMPAGSDQAALPRPTDDSVVLRDVPEHIALATRFSGRWTSSLFDSQISQLSQVAREQEMTLAGDPRFARYNPPWTPWFLRRNEVVWEVSNAA